MVSVFALLGQSLFQTKLVFHPITGQHVEECSGSASKYFSDECKAICDPIGDCKARLHFDQFLWAVNVVFIILTGEEWVPIMFSGMRATSFPFSFYFCSVICIGNFLLLNLFVAILLVSFEQQSAQNRAIRQAQKIRFEEEERRKQELSEAKKLGLQV